MKILRYFSKLYDGWTGGVGVGDGVVGDGSAFTTSQYIIVIKKKIIFSQS